MNLGHCRYKIYLFLFLNASAWAGTDVVVTVGENDGGAPALAFHPSVLSVSPGDTITFTNNPGSGTHNAHSVDTAFPFQCGPDNCVNAAPTAGSWTSPRLTVPPAAAGKTISYQCDLHGAAMVGQIVVNATTPVRLQDFEVD